MQLTSVADLSALAPLDPKVWGALSCPVNDLEMDRQTLSLIDCDTDGRVQQRDAAAVQWTLTRLARPESLFAGGDLPLDAIDISDPIGEQLVAPAKRIWANMGKPDSRSISVEQAANTAKMYGQSRLIGDGVIAKDATDDREQQQLMTEIASCLGP